MKIANNILKVSILLVLSISLTLMSYKTLANEEPISPPDVNPKIIEQFQEALDCMSNLRLRAEPETCIKVVYYNTKAFVPGISEKDLQDYKMACYRFFKYYMEKSEEESQFCFRELN